MKNLYSEDCMCCNIGNICNQDEIKEVGSR